ncbi:hypothetical protein PINS_up019594 [Pythium insidiosum]|nr:hypothetical protein PINS_up019594 [Pythium insidiosum]
MVRDAGLTHIRFDGLERHTETQDPIREVLDRFGVGELDMDALIKSDDGLLNTYRAFRKFLKKDLAHKWAEMSNTQASKQMGDIAKRMMHRNVGFSRLVDHVYPSAVRISIHLYDNAGPKFGVYLLPHDADSPNVPRTPWHSVVCENLDGTVIGVDLDSVDHDRYELVEKRGRAWGFRERAKGAATASATSVSAGVTGNATAGVSDALSAMTIKAEQTTKNTANAIDAIDLSVDELKKQWDDLDVDFVEEPFLLIIQARNTQQPPSMDARAGGESARAGVQVRRREPARLQAGRRPGAGGGARGSRARVAVRQGVRDQVGGRHGADGPDARGHANALRRSVQEEAPGLDGAGRRVAVPAFPLRRGVPEPRR